MKLTVLGAALGATLIVGCAANTSEDQPVPSEMSAAESFEQSQTALEPIAEVETPTGSVLFYADDGGHISMGEMMSLDAGTSVIKHLQGDDALTNLEIYQALTDDLAPQELVDAHDEEALSLGRESTDVRKVELDLDAPVEKLSGGCATFFTQSHDQKIFDWTGLVNQRHTHTKFDRSGNSGNVHTGWHRTHGMAVGAWCNDQNTDTLQTRAFWWESGSNSVAIPNLPPRHAFIWARADQGNLWALIGGNFSHNYSMYLAAFQDDI